MIASLTLDWYQGHTSWVQDQDPENPVSRGDLLTVFMQSSSGPIAFFQQCQQADSSMRGYNAICGDVNSMELWHHSNRGRAEPVQLSSGLHAMSNGVIDDEWPKMRCGKERLGALLEAIGAQGAHWFPYAVRSASVHCDSSCPDPLILPRVKVTKSTVQPT
jgi:uncharacterized protein with NRDE domain